MTRIGKEGAAGGETGAGAGGGGGGGLMSIANT